VENEIFLAFYLDRGNWQVLDKWPELPYPWKMKLSSRDSQKTKLSSREYVPQILVRYVPRPYLRI